mmetsp:Transcript_41564/g.114485  ORF Transcript_41564/g.114485 Transcript_41564/m.114485 type:complete len:259 (+) Transcript_41564:980-1756(+)
MRAHAVKPFHRIVWATSLRARVYHRAEGHEVRIEAGLLHIPEPLDCHINITFLATRADDGTVRDFLRPVARILHAFEPRPRLLRARGLGACKHECSKHRTFNAHLSALHGTEPPLRSFEVADLGASPDDDGVQDRRRTHHTGQPAAGRDGIAGLRESAHEDGINLVVGGGAGKLHGRQPNLGVKVPLGNDEGGDQFAVILEPRSESSGLHPSNPCRRIIRVARPNAHVDQRGVRNRIWLESGRLHLLEPLHPAFLCIP